MHLLRTAAGCEIGPTPAARHTTDIDVDDHGERLPRHAKLKLDFFSEEAQPY